MILVSSLNNDVAFGCVMAGVLLIPVIIGLLFKKFPPKKINHWCGYRTRTSKKSQKAWDYSQRLCANAMIIFSLASLVVYAAAVLIACQFLSDVLLFSAVLGSGLVLAGMIGAIIFTEVKTKKFIKNQKEENNDGI